ncbi:MAG: alpha/beta hydrolase [Acidobacteria bacterium]|nr:alpha/beta hydrolase [Acidobacteriota bacterium]
MKRGLAISAAVAGGLGVWTGVRFRNWSRREKARLRSGGTLQSTASGPIEYASRGEGPVVLIAHGALGGYDQGLAIANLMGIPGVRFLAVSRPGYLRTPLQSGRTYRDQAHLFAAFLDSMEISQAVVMGISAGGPAALEFAREHPGKCAGVILLSAISRRLREQDVRVPPALALASTPFWDFGGWLMQGLMHRKPGTAARWMLQPQESEMLRDPGMRAAFLSLADTFVPFSPRRAGLLNDGEQIGLYPDAAPAGIECPALILHGTADDVVPYEHATSAAAAIPGAELVPLPGGGHLAGVFQPGAVNSNIERFLSAVRGSV